MNHGDAFLIRSHSMGSGADVRRRKQMAGLTGPHDVPRSFTNYIVGTADFILPLNGHKCWQGNRKPSESFRLASLRGYPEGCRMQKPQISGSKGPQNARVQERGQAT